MKPVGQGWLLVVAAIAVLTLIGVAFLLDDHAPAVQPADSGSVGVLSAPTAGKPLPVIAATPGAGGKVDICGYGWVEQGAAEEIESKAQTVAERTLGRVAVRLAASKDERESALGLSLPAWISEGIRDEYLQDHPECQNNQSCEQYAQTLADQKTNEIVDERLKSASASRDPQVYALALQACGVGFGNAFGYRGGGGSCALLSVERWAELEPDNGAPWLLVAQKANDAGTRDQAVYHAATAKRFDAYLPNFIGMLQWPEIRGEPPQTRWAVAAELYAKQLTQPVLSYAPFLRFCNYPSAADPTRIGACSNLANLLLEQDHTLMGLGAGVRLAEAAGWQPDKVKALREEKDAVYKVAQGGIGAPKGSRVGSDCEDLARLEHWSADYAGLGQLGLARKIIAASRKAPATLAPGSGDSR
jgi:hypothetical protein